MNTKQEIQQLERDSQYIREQTEELVSELEGMSMTDAERLEIEGYRNAAEEARQDGNVNMEAFFNRLADRAELNAAR